MCQKTLIDSPAPSEPRFCVAVELCTTAKPFVRPDKVAEMLVTVDPPVLVITPPAHAESGPCDGHWLLSKVTSCVAVRLFPVVSVKLSAAYAGCAMNNRKNTTHV